MSKSLTETTSDQEDYTNGLEVPKLLSLFLKHISNTDTAIVAHHTEEGNLNKYGKVFQQSPAYLVKAQHCYFEGTKKDCTNTFYVGIA